MDAFPRLIAALLLLALTAGRMAGAQETPLLEPFEPVTGTLSAGESLSWRFNGSEGAAFSFYVEPTGGDLDPVLTLTDRAGAIISANDDYDYPESRAALIQTITLPRLDVYTVTLSGFGETSGGFTLIALPGYGDLAYRADLDEDEPWETEGDSLLTDASGGQFALNLTESGARGLALPPNSPTLDDTYLHADVVEITGRPTWTVGMIARWQDARNFYLFVVNQRGQWRFLLRTPAGDRVLRDWVNHPAIPPGEMRFALGLLANGPSFEFFYNGQLIGRVTDGSIADAGRFGLAVETATTLDSEVTARFQSFALTTPRTSSDDARPIPQQILVAPSTIMAPDLQRQGLIPSDGRIALTVPQNFVTLGRPGISRFTLGGGVRYEYLALGARFTWSIQGEGPAGCAVLLGDDGGDNYTIAYLDRDGGYGVSRRSADSFAPGLYGEDPALAAGTSHHLLVIAREDALLLYIDGRYRGQLDAQPGLGTIASAAINFESVSTSCDFTDTWVYTWE